MTREEALNLYRGDVYDHLVQHGSPGWPTEADLAVIARCFEQAMRTDEAAALVRLARALPCMVQA